MPTLKEKKNEKKKRMTWRGCHFLLFSLRIYPMKIDEEIIQ
jgi:hypothetical protein